MTPEEIRQLFDYNDWANQRSQEGATQLSEEQFTKPLGSSFPSVRDTLVHICSGEWVWLQRCQGRTPAAFPHVSHIPTISSLPGYRAPPPEPLRTFLCDVGVADLVRVMV